jgi:hypothetical protein
VKVMMRKIRFPQGEAGGDNRARRRSTEQITGLEKRWARQSRNPTETLGFSAMQLSQARRYGTLVRLFTCLLCVRPVADHRGRVAGLGVSACGPS